MHMLAQFTTPTASGHNLNHRFDSLAPCCEVAEIERLMCQYGEKKGELCQAWLHQVVRLVRSFAVACESKSAASGVA